MLTKLGFPTYSSYVPFIKGLLGARIELVSMHIILHLMFRTPFIASMSVLHFKNRRKHSRSAVDTQGRVSPSVSEVPCELCVLWPGRNVLLGIRSSEARSRAGERGLLAGSGDHRANALCPLHSDLRGRAERHGGRGPESGLPWRLPQQSGLHLDHHPAHRVW